MSRTVMAPGRQDKEAMAAMALEEYRKKTMKVQVKIDQPKGEFYPWFVKRCVQLALKLKNNETLTREDSRFHKLIVSLLSLQIKNEKEAKK